MFKLFADDAKLYSPIKKENDRIRMQVGLKMLKNGPKYGKCSSISKNANIFTLGKTHPDTQYIMSVDKNQTEEMLVTGEKDLDVISDEKLRDSEIIYSKRLR